MSGIQNTAGGKTFPKKGRLGSGAYWPQGTPINGNVFGPNADQPLQPPAPPIRPFGSPSNAGNNTQFGQNRATSGTGLSNPNAGFYSISQQPKVPAFVYDGATFTPLSPFAPNPVVEPQTRNRLLTRKVFGKFRTASGASRTLPSDTAFNRVPPVQRPPAPRPPQNYTLQLQRSGSAGASFVSRNNQWQDPNNSFLKGVSSPGGAGVGAARWSTIKKGAAG